MSGVIRRDGATAPRRGAEVLLEILQSENVEYIFGNPGTTELPLIDALSDVPIDYVLGLQEASVVAMADGYAQAARKPAFLNLHTAGGLGNGMGNLLNATASQPPLVVTVGQQDSRHLVADPLLLGDLVRLSEPAVKWAQEVTTADHLPVLVRRAFHDADAAPSGPVLLSLPMDVMEEMSAVGIAERSTIRRRVVAESLDELLAHLLEVTPGRLAIIAGDEIYRSQAAAEAVTVAELLGARVYGSSWPSRIPFPTSHPLWSGCLPTTARAISEVLSSYDAILALGGKSLITILYSEGSAVPEGCRIFQLSSDVRDLGRTYVTKLSLLGDIGASLNVLIPMIKAAIGDDTATYRDILAQAAEQRSSRRRILDSQVERELEGSAITPLVAARETARAIGRAIAIVDEAIATSKGVREFLDSNNPAQYSFLRGGGLGWGMPAAVGCSLGLGREPVVCLVGDGAAMYSPQALWTAAHEKLPVTFVVMNNREYNVLKNFMRSQSGYISARTNNFIGMDLRSPTIDYVALAASMGVPACRIMRAANLADAIEAGIASRAVNLIEVLIST